MRVMMRVNMATEPANEAAKNGTLSTKIQEILAIMKPEAAYFSEEGGERTAYIVFDMKDSSELPGVAEPWFIAFNARLTVRPAMTPQDLGNAAQGFKQAVEKFGKG